MPSQLPVTDLVVLLLYMGGIFALGCYFARKNKNPDHFMTAGRSLPGWAVGLSVFGTFVSSLGFLGNAGAAFGGTWNKWVFGLSLPIAALIAARWFVPHYRNSGEISAYAWMEKRFGPWARLYAVVCYLLMQLARIGSILFLVALPLAPLTGWDITTIILVTGLLVTVYTLVGGIEAVIWTDVVQSVVLITGAILCAVLLLTNMPGGAKEMLVVANAENKFSLGGFSLRPSSLTALTPTFWMVLIYGLFINLQNFGVDQGFVQRYMTAKSDRDAKFSLWLTAIMFPLVSALLFFIGTALYSYYTSVPGLMQDLKQQVVASGFEINKIDDKALPHYIVHHLPTGVAGLLIAAIFAAAMSSVDTSLNSSATLVLCDFYKRYVRPNADDHNSMRVLQLTTLVLGIAGTLTALAMIRVKSALDAWWNLQGILAGGVLGLFLLGFISKRAKNPTAIIAVVLGTLLIGWLSLPSFVTQWPEKWKPWANPFHKNMTIVFGTTSIVLIGIIISSFTWNRKKDN